MLLPFCLDFFVQNILFYIKEADLSIFLEFQELPSGEVWQNFRVLEQVTLLEE